MLLDLNCGWQISERLLYPVSGERWDAEYNANSIYFCSLSRIRLKKNKKNNSFIEEAYFAHFLQFYVITWSLWNLSVMFLVEMNKVLFQQTAEKNQQDLLLVLQEQLCKR